jgi:hypothetical protein
MGEQTDGRICELIGSAVMAGAYSALARQHPNAQGLTVLWAKWDRRVEALAQEVAGRAAQTARPLESW